MEHSGGLSTTRAKARTLAGAIGVTVLAALAACSANGGQRAAGPGPGSGGAYRTGATGEALSRAAAWSPAELARMEAGPRRNAAAAPRAESGRTSSSRGDGAKARASTAAPQEPASRPALDSRAFQAEAPGGGQRADAAPSNAALAVQNPTRAAVEPRASEQQALTSGTMLAPALLGEGGAATRPATQAGFLAGWRLGPTQVAVLALGLLLSTLAALLAAWATARRKRALAEPRVATPVAANDPGPVPAPRMDGPQLALPLSPAGTVPRIYSAGASARLTSRRP